ncbi:acyl-CoA dehydrogenase family protein [Vitreimonas sp.]|uniref:acyl-CoA dehydrogenase family protein n=1 Tax=Vitreimonas sp. TaxID=3069702 RepID=UPI002EDB2C88
MNLELEDDEIQFRDEVRAFLRDNLTPELAAGGRSATSVFCDPQYSLPWQRILHARGWAAPTWPKEFGGPGWSEMQRYIFAEECARAGAPNLAPMGLRMVGPCIMHHGTPEQRAYYLPRILSGEDYWCQGYSEPGAGSDLANLRTRADSDGDHYVINGSKIWTTHAHFANMMFGLVRTDPDAKPQKGITFLLIDMKAPGVTIRPIINLAGEHELNEVFFDNVRVPKANRIGAENDGWTVAKYLLEFERGGSFAPALRVCLKRIRAAASAESELGPPLLDDSAFAARLASAEIKVEAIQITEHRVASALSSGQNPGPLSSMLKTQGTEMLQKIEELGLDLAAHYAPVARAHANGHGANEPPIGNDAAARYFNSRAASIYGGSNEIQRNIMARLVLGL